MSASFFTELEQNRIVTAIRDAEMNTSGEIRLHVEAECAGDPYNRALEVFEQLHMHQTEARNGVLFYLAYQSKKFAIVGDQGIHEKVSQRFWDREKENMAAAFASGKFCDGLVAAITDAGNRLKEYFPYQASDKNELTNDISFGDGGPDA